MINGQEIGLVVDWNNLNDVNPDFKVLILKSMELLLDGSHARSNE